MHYINNGKNIEFIFLKNSKVKNDIDLLIFRINDYYDTNNLKNLNNSIKCDYVAIYKGKFIAIELKETHNNEKFNFYKLKLHQKLFLKNIHNLNGISFLGIYFIELNKFFLVPILSILKIQKSGVIFYSDLIKKFVSFDTNNKQDNLYNFIIKCVENYRLE